MKKNLLIINYEYPPVGAGAASFTQSLIEKLTTNNNYNITLLTSKYGGLKSYEKVSDSFQIFRVNSKRKSLCEGTILGMIQFMFNSFFYIRKIVQQTKPEVCLNFFGIPCGPVALYLKIFFKIPYVLCLRGGDVPGFSPAETGLYHKILSPINKVIWKNASFITANSEGLKKLALNFFNYKPIEIIYNGVNVKLFKNLEFLKKENKKTVKLLFVGRLAKQKNLFNFIKYVFNDFIKKKKLNVTFTIIGDGPEKVVLKNLIEKLELKEFIEIENWQPREKLAEIYNNFDLFVMPSLYEGMSNVVIEAKLCGLKVVGFDIAGNKELFEKDKDIIIENENYKMMIEKICELINSNNLNKNVSKEFLDKFSMEKISTKFIKLIEGCEN